jgi:hypothetical protein
MSNRSTTRTTIAAMAASFALGGAVVFAEEPKATDPNPAAVPKATPEQRTAATAGLTWLAKQQSADGSFKGHQDKPGAAHTAIAGLAFLSAGSTPDAGDYKDNIRKALDYLLKNRSDAGQLANDGLHGSMYGHGFALVFLSEACSRTKDKELSDRLRPAIEKAIDLSAAAQNAEGGWRYTAQPVDADVSVTAGQLTALQAAQTAGFQVNKQVIARALKYINTCQNADGGFSYMVNAGGSGPARSAAALAVLARSGQENANAAERARGFLENVKVQTDAHYFYHNYYMLQSHLGGAFKRDWYDALRADLLKRQNADTGKWKGDSTESYSTAMAVLLLQMPEHPLTTLKIK